MILYQEHHSQSYMYKKLLIFALFFIAATTYAATVYTVPQGGTGASTFSWGWVLSNGGKSALTSSSSPTVGYITATTSTSTLAGVNLPTGCYAINGLCIAGTNYFTNSGSDTYLNTGTNLQAPTLNATSTTGTSTFAGGLSAASSLYVLQNGSVGIGTTSPYAKLSVAGPIVGQYFTATSTTDSSTFAGNVGLGTSPVYTNGIFSIRNSSDAGYIALTRAAQSSWSIRLDSTGALGIWDVDGSNYPLYIVSSADTYGGNVGIGTTSPYAKLSVAGPVVGQYFTATSTTDYSTFGGTVGIATTSSYLGGTLNVAGNVRIVPGAGIGSKSTKNGSSVMIVKENTGTESDIHFVPDVSSTTASNIHFAYNSDAPLRFGAGSAKPYYSTFDSLNYTSFLANGTESMRIDSSGNVGIGTTSPYAKLSVAGSIVAGILTATTTTATSSFMGNIYSATSTVRGNATIQNSGVPSEMLQLSVLQNLNGVVLDSRTTNGNFLFYVNGAEKARINSTGSLTLGGDGSYAGAARLSVNGGVSVGTVYKQTSSPTDGMIIAGLTGHGTSTPAWPLQIASSSKPQLALSDTTAGVGMKHWTMRSVGGVFYLATSTDSTYATSSVAALVVNSNGYVGIGIAVPTQALEVNGGVRLNTATAQPTCSTDTRGLFWVVQNGAGVKDDVQVCAKDAADAMAWRTIY